MPNIVITLLLVVSTTALAVPSPSSNAAEFIAKGASTALRSCDLPQRKCGGENLVVKSVNWGESNGEKRSVETLVATGMEAKIVFVANNRSNFYLGEVEVSDQKWPNFKGVGVGAKRETVRRTLGHPNGGTKDTCDNYFDEEKQANAYVCYRSSKVARVRWEYFID